MKNQLLLTLFLSAAGFGASHAAIPVDFSKISSWAGHGPNRAALVVTNDAGASDPHAYVWGYRWEDGEEPTGETMFRAVCARSDELVLLTQITGQYGSTVCGIGYGDAENLLEHIHFDFEMAKNYEFINFDYYNTSSFFGQTDAPGDNSPAIAQAAIDKAISDNSHVIDHPFNHPKYGYPAYDYDCWPLDDSGSGFGWWNSAWYSGYWSYWTGTEGGDDWNYSGTGFTGRRLTDGAIDGWSFTMFDEPQVGGIGEGATPPADPTLYVYRDVKIESSGIENPDADETTSHTVDYYSLQGVKVAECRLGDAAPVLSPGIYIVRNNTATTKIIIR